MLVGKSLIILIGLKRACKRLIRYIQKSPAYSKYLDKAYDTLRSKKYCFSTKYRGGFPLFDTISPDKKVYYAVWRVVEEILLQFDYSDVYIRSDCSDLIIDAIPALFYVRLMSICKAGKDDRVHTFVVRDRLDLCYRLDLSDDAFRRLKKIRDYYSYILDEVLTVIKPYDSRSV